MEKVQVRLNKSEYQVYHEYCRKYYQAHDTVRKQSVYTGIDLFLKGVLPVEEQDISRARWLLAGKCEELRKEQAASGSDDGTALLQIRACSDLLLFMDDLEKIYRLMEKEGVVADYVALLGTFSKVIDEYRHAHPPAALDLDNELVDALALPLAGTISLRLGTDPPWEDVIRELSSIAARFNLRSSGLKFDLDILRAIAPAVVSCFDTDVEPGRILAALPACFEERELEEFATFLDHAPDGGGRGREAEGDRDALARPLEAVCQEIAKRRDRGSPGGRDLPDPYSLVPVADRFPATRPAESRTFTLVVSPDRAGLKDAQPAVYSQPEGPPQKSGIPPVLLVIVGMALLIAFLAGALMMNTGTWPGPGAGNATGPQDPAVPTTTTGKPTAAPAPKATTAPLKGTATPAATPTKILYYSAADIANHLTDVAFDPDYNVIQKPTKNPIDITFSGSYTSEDVDLLTGFISQFNIYSSFTRLSGNPNFNSEADINIVFLPAISLVQTDKVQNTTHVYRDARTGAYYIVSLPEKTLVNADLRGDERKRWILRALLNDLGFYGETAKYPDSVFYAGPSNASHLSEIDWKAVELMYGNKITNGMRSVR